MMMILKCYSHILSINFFFFFFFFFFWAYLFLKIIHCSTVSVIIITSIMLVCNIASKEILCWLSPVLFNGISTPYRLFNAKSFLHLFLLSGHADSKDFLDSLLPSISISYCICKFSRWQQVFRELMNANFFWLANTSVLHRRTWVCPCFSNMSCLSWMVC